MVEEFETTVLEVLVFVHVVLDPLFVLADFGFMIACEAADAIDVDDDVDATVVEQVMFVGYLGLSRIEGGACAVAVGSVLVDDESFARHMVLHGDLSQRLNDRIEIRGAYVAEIDAGYAVVTWKHPFWIDRHFDKGILLKIGQKKVDFVLYACLTDVEVEKEEEIILFAEGEIGLDSTIVDMVAVCSLVARKVIGYADDQIYA